MKAVAVFCVLFAVCYAQEPPKKPVISETFIAKNVTVHRRDHQHGDHMGQGYFERSYDANEGMEAIDVKFTTSSGTYEDENILRFDTKMDYNIRMEDSKNPVCQKRKIDSGLKMRQMWNWVNSDEAHGRRCEDPRTKKEFDCWTMHMEVSSFLTLIVDNANPNVPIALIETRKGEEEDMRFNGSFEPKNPPKTDFEPPASCM